MSAQTFSGLRRTAVITTAALTALLGAAATASAHVTVNPNTAEQGGYTKVSFRVPNEEANASTTTVEVDLPTDTPVASVSTKPVPGWTAEATTSQLATPIKTDDGDPVTQAVTKIVWSGGKIDPGQFQEFDVSLGPLPKTSQIVFKALQTYSDGTIVRWIDMPAAAGQPEPAHPAPILHLTAATDVAPDSTATTAAPTVTATTGAGTTATAAAAKSSDSDGTARALGIGGLVVGVLGLGTAVFALRRKNTPAA